GFDVSGKDKGKELPSSSQDCDERFNLQPVKWVQSSLIEDRLD
ncbi:unnamed protein product, partial [marine sediment metagenome]